MNKIANNKEEQMIGKKNVVFGFIYLVFTAALGPYMINAHFADVGAAAAEKQTALSRLQDLRTNNYEEMLEPLEPGQIARANTDGILALNKLGNAEAPVDAIKGGPHAHGNLEALLNIAVGIALAFIAVAPLFKQVISWVFLLGALIHSGGLYLDTLFGIGFLVGPVGPVLILLGLLLAGVAAWMGWQSEPVRD
ncbi:MAG: hypothetical protein HUJ29_13445 [Gammaproteobacteria bacterium]|nr:hypothetical protein [Gammaproteobacteria bacterium]